MQKGGLLILLVGVVFFFFFQFGYIGTRFDFVKICNRNQQVACAERL